MSTGEGAVREITTEVRLGQHRRAEQMSKQNLELREGHTTDEGEWPWVAARVIQKALSRYHQAVETAVAGALAQADIPLGVRHQVLAAFRAQRDQGDIERLWSLALPGLQPLDACDLMRWRPVVPASMGEATALRQVCESTRAVNENLLDNARRYALDEELARRDGDLERMQQCQLRSTIYEEIAEFLTDQLTHHLNIWDQYNLAERPPEITSTGGSLGRPTAPPPLDMGDLRDPEATPREQLVAMVEQAITVRAQLAWSAIRRLAEPDQGGGGSLHPDEDRAAAIALAQGADLLEAGLAAGAGRYKELGRHVAQHGRCLDQVI